MEWWRIPSIIAAVLTVTATIVGGFYKLGRKDSSQQQTLETLTKKIKDCEDHAYVSLETCNKSQEKCRKQQAVENERILKAIDDLVSKFEEQQQQNYNELMKMNKSLGRIEGVIGRHRLDT